MTSTTRLAIEDFVDGQYAADANINGARQALEDAMLGHLQVDVASADQTLTNAQWRGAAVFSIVNASASGRVVNVPQVEKTGLFRLEKASAYPVTVKVGTAKVFLAPGEEALVRASGAANNLERLTPRGGPGRPHVLAARTTDGTATRLTADGAAADTVNSIPLADNSLMRVEGSVIARASGGDAKEWTIEALVKRGSGAGTTALVGTATVTAGQADTGAASWTLALAADTTNGCISLTGTGATATTIVWRAHVRTIET